MAEVHGRVVRKELQRDREQDRIELALVAGDVDPLDRGGVGQPAQVDTLVRDDDQRPATRRDLDDIGVKRAKSEAKRSMRTPVEKVKVHDTPERLGALDKAAVDVRSAGVIGELWFDKADEMAVEVTLGEEPAKD